MKYLQASMWLHHYKTKDVLIDQTSSLIWHEQQGDFKISIKHDGHGMTLQTTDSTGNILHYLTAQNIRWKNCIKAVLKVQRYVIAKKLQNVGCSPNEDTFKIKSLIQFKKFQLLPYDIMDWIIDLYFDPNHKHEILDYSKQTNSNKFNFVCFVVCSVAIRGLQPNGNSIYAHTKNNARAHTH